MSRFTDPVDLLAAPDPVGEFRRAHASGQVIALRTAGTTSRPRAVVRTTLSWTSSFDAVSRLAGLTPDSRIWVPGPITATMNLFAHVHASDLGATVVDDAHRASHAVLTPLALARALDVCALAEGSTVIVAGDAMSPAVLSAAGDQGLTVHHYYGASELSFVAWESPGAAMTAFPGVDIRVVDSIIWARSPYLALGYLDESASGALRWDADGFASVGDRGSLHHGALQIHGRGIEGITTAGVTVLVADVEHTLRPAARGEVFIVGLPDARLGAVVVALLTDPQDRAAVERAARTLEPAQRPRRWVHLPEIPLTAAGKPDRERMTEMLAAPGLSEVGR